MEVAKVIEYPKVYQLNYMTQLGESKSVNVVCEVNKDTKEVKEVSMYTNDEEETILIKPPKPQVEAPIMCIRAPCVVDEVEPESEEVTTIVKYLEQSSEIARSKITKVIKAEKTTTVFGSDVVKIVAVTGKGEQIETVVNYNPETK